MSVFNFSISYKNLIQIETEIGNAVAANKRYITIGQGLHLAIDNTDFKNDTPDGNRNFIVQLHFFYTNHPLQGQIQVVGNHSTGCHAGWLHREQRCQGCS